MQARRNCENEARNGDVKMGGRRSKKNG